MAASDECDEDDDIGFDCSLAITSIRDEFICSICLRIVEDPARLSCGHLFCSSHVFRRLKKGDACPKCGAACELRDLDEQTRTSLQSIRFKCVNEGCTMQCSIFNLREHSLQCPLSTTSCTWPSCPETNILRRDVAAHEDICPYRPTACPLGCGSTIAAAKVSAHILRCSEQNLSPERNLRLEAEATSPSETPAHDLLDEHRVPDCGNPSASSECASCNPSIQYSMLSDELSSLSLQLASCRNRLRAVTARSVVKFTCAPASEESAVDILTYGNYIFSILEDGQVMLVRSDGVSFASTLLGGRFRNVQCLTVSRHAVVAGSPAGAVRVWTNAADALDGPPGSEKELLLKYVMSAVISEDSSVLRVALSDQGTLWVCMAATVFVYKIHLNESDLNLVASIPLPNRFHDACLVEGGSLVCVLHQTDMLVIASDGAVSTLPPHSERAVYCVCSRGLALFCGAREGGLLCFRRKEPGVFTVAGSTLSSTQDTCVSVAVNDCGLLAAGHASGHIALYFVDDLDAPSCLHVMRTPDGIVALGFLDDGSLVHQGGRLYVWK